MNSIQFLNSLFMYKKSHFLPMIDGKFHQSCKKSMRLNNANNIFCVHGNI